METRERWKGIITTQLGHWLPWGEMLGPEIFLRNWKSEI